VARGSPRIRESNPAGSRRTRDARLWRDRPEAGKELKEVRKGVSWIGGVSQKQNDAGVLILWCSLGSKMWLSS
jgi:hypothetical protein